MSSNPDTNTGSDTTFTICEAVDYSNAHTLQEKVDSFIDQCDDNIRIEFIELPVSNSLIVALMMSWYRRAELAEKKLSFHQLPAGIKKIVEITGLGRTLPIEN